MSNEEDRIASAIVQSLDGLIEAEPPFSLRSRLLNEARKRRPPVSGVAGTKGVDTYRNAMEDLDSLLESLTDEQWQRGVVNSWTVAGVVTHLRVVDEIAAATLRGRVDGEVTVDIEERTRQAIGGVGSNVEASQQWREQASDLLRAFENCRAEAVDYIGFMLAPEAVIIDRAFETWLHTQDIRIALGGSLQPPVASDLVTLTDLGVRMLTKVVSKAEHDERGSVRLVLEDVGSWLVPLTGDDTSKEPHTTVVIDPIDFCLLVGDRLSLADLSYAVEGSPAAASAVLSYASELARL